MELKKDLHLQKVKWASHKQAKTSMSTYLSIEGMPQHPQSSSADWEVYWFHMFKEISFQSLADY
jgi:hypothetical protein